MTAVADVSATGAPTRGHGSAAHREPDRLVGGEPRLDQRGVVELALLVGVEPREVRLLQLLVAAHGPLVARVEPTVLGRAAEAEVLVADPRLLGLVAGDAAVAKVDDRHLPEVEVGRLGRFFEPPAVALVDVELVRVSRRVLARRVVEARLARLVRHVVVGDGVHLGRVPRVAIERRQLLGIVLVGQRRSRHCPRCEYRGGPGCRNRLVPVPNRTGTLADDSARVGAYA